MKYKAISILLMALFAAQSYAAEFEALGSRRALGDVYDSLMDAAELNEYIVGQGISAAGVKTNGGRVVHTTYNVDSPFDVDHVIDTQGLSEYDSGYKSNVTWLSYIVVIKGDEGKYSLAIVMEYLKGNSAGGNIYVHIDSNSILNDNTKLLNGRRINIAIKGKPVQAVKPNAVFLMAFGFQGNDETTF